MSQLNVTELDFENIKANLKTFLSTQDEFSDYNFEGSALNVLVNTLAYNTHYNAMLAHMLANESFLDTAVKRASVVSIAKSLGYTPTSKKAAASSINITVFPDPAYTATTLTLLRGTPIQTTVGSNTFTFFPQEDVTATLTNVAELSADVFQFLAVEIKEGRRISNSFIVDGQPLEPFVIPNKDVDTSTIRVRVQKSATDFSVDSYFYKSKITTVKSTDKVFFLEEGIDGYYSIKFGDDIIGKKLDAGNFVIIDYLNTAGSDANNAKVFTVGNTITGSAESVTVTTIANSSGGTARESVESIKQHAPRYNATKERAVTSNDYQALILAENANVQSVSVWGGEDNVPPMYGKVFISLNPYPGSIITQIDKDRIQNEIIEPRTPVAIQPEFVDPEYTYVGVNAATKYNSKTTSLTGGQIEAGVLSAVSEFFTVDLNNLNKNLYYSDLHDTIKNTSDSILSVTLNLKVQKRIPMALLNAIGNFKSTFNVKVQPRTLSTTWMDVAITGVTYKSKFVDVPASTVVSPGYFGSGSVWLQDPAGKLLKEIGTIDYDTGVINIPEIVISALYATDTSVKINMIPHNSVKDLTTDILTRTADISEGAVVAKPAKNTILSLDDSPQNIVTGSTSGVIVTAVPRSQEN